MQRKKKREATKTKPTAPQKEAVGVKNAQTVVIGAPTSNPGLALRDVSEELKALQLDDGTLPIGMSEEDAASLRSLRASFTAEAASTGVRAAAVDPWAAEARPPAEPWFNHTAGHLRPLTQAEATSPQSPASDPWAAEAASPQPPAPVGDLLGDLFGAAAPPPRDEPSALAQTSAEANPFGGGPTDPFAGATQPSTAAPSIDNPFGDAPSAGAAEAPPAPQAGNPF